MGRHRSYGSKRENTERLILDSLEEIAGIADLRGIILDANEALGRSLGRNVKDLIGECIWDLLPPDLSEERKVHFEEVLRSARPVRFEDQRGDRWFESPAYPILDQEGRVGRVVLLAKDITERKDAQKSLKEKDQLLNNVLEASPIGIAYAEERRVKSPRARPYPQGKGRSFSSLPRA